VQKADLEPAGGCAPKQIALDETVIKVNGERFWIYAAVDPATNQILHWRLYPARYLALTK
jgi:putative transposase